MSLFLTTLACNINSEEQVIEAMISIMNKRSFKLISKTKVYEITGKENMFEVSNVQNSWVQVFCSETIDKNFAKEISKSLSCLVFAFSIVGGEFWQYELYSSGILKDQHNPIPDYWKNINTQGKRRLKGNSLTLSSLFNISKPKIEKYLFFWNSNKKNRLQDPWKMVDFQKEFGIEYPDFEKTETVNLTRLIFKIS